MKVYLVGTNVYIINIYIYIVTKSSNSLIITNTELNALSIYESTKLPVISLPYNTLHIPVSVLHNIYGNII